MLVGIIGKPNCGKSTFFKALTLADILIANYPFATIDANKGFAHVTLECVDKELGVECNPRVGMCINHTRFVPIEVMDVAGLVPGAHEGKGLGNKFLEDLRQADALIHVVDASGTTNEKGEPIAGGNDPCDDILFLEEEINRWMYNVLMKVWERFARATQQTKENPAKAIAKQMSAFNVNEDLAKDLIKKLGLSNSLPEWSETQIFDFIKGIRQATKPILIAANKADLPEAEENIKRMKQKFPEMLIIPMSAASELALREAGNKKLVNYVPGSDTFEMIGEMSEAQRKGLQYIKENVMSKFGSTGVQTVINTAVFDLLKIIAVFPGGVHKLADSEGRVLPDCFLLKQGSTAYNFAEYIHTDLAKGFIKAIDVRTKLSMGRDHVLKHRDIIEIMSNM